MSGRHDLRDRRLVSGQCLGLHLWHARNGDASPGRSRPRLPAPFVIAALAPLNEFASPQLNGVDVRVIIRSGCHVGQAVATAHSNPQRSLLTEALRFVAMRREKFQSHLCTALAPDVDSRPKRGRPVPGFSAANDRSSR